MVCFCTQAASFAVKYAVSTGRSLWTCGSFSGSAHVRNGSTATRHKRVTVETYHKWEPSFIFWEKIMTKSNNTDLLHVLHQRFVYVLHTIQRDQGTGIWVGRFMCVRKVQP